MKYECRDCRSIYMFNPHDYAMPRCPECGSHEYSVVTERPSVCRG